MRLYLVNLCVASVILSVIPAVCPTSLSLSPFVAQALSEQDAHYQDQKAKADRLLREGLSREARGNIERARQNFSEALFIYQELGDKAGIGTTLQNLGYIYQRTEEYDQALDYYRKALPIQQEIRDGNGEQLTFKFIGEIYDSQGRDLAAQNQYQAAIEKFQQALEIHRKLGFKESELRTLDQIGIAYTNLGEYELALNFYQQALPIQKDVVLGEWVGIDFKIGQIYQILGQYELALQSYQEALEIAKIPLVLVFDSRKQIGDIAGEVKALNAIGNIHYRLQQYDLALDFYQQALSVLKTIDNKTAKKSLEASIFNNIGIVYLKQNKAESALDFFQKAFTINKSLSHKQPEGVFLNNMGRAYFELGQYDLAENAYQQSLLIAQETDNKQAQGHIFKNMGYLLEKQNQPELAIIFFKQSVNAREAIRNKLKGLPQEFQQSYTETIAEDYRHLADLLLKQDRILEAQRVLDLLKVQELDDYLNNVRGTGNTAPGLPNLPPEQQLTDSYQSILNQAIRLGKELTQLRQQSNRTPQEEQRLVQLVNAQEKLVENFNTFIESSEVETLISQLTPKTRKPDLVDDLEDLISLQDNLRNLQQNAVLLYPLILDDRIELILTTPDSPPIRRTVPVSKSQLNQAIVEFRQALQTPNSNAEIPAQKLYNWLIQPLEADLNATAAQTIIYAADGQLRYIPLAALYDGNKWLVERYQINNITAASLTDLNTKPQAQLNILAAAFTKGTYHFNINGQTFDLAGLPFAKVEVETLAKTVPNTTTLLDQAFTPEATVPKMDDYTVVHFATHGAFVTGSPEESFILFGNGTRVTLKDMEKWSLKNVDLVVLSACETGIGGQLGNGEEILGLGYQMQRAGARAVIASLWTVDDGSTQLLMNEFYRTLQSETVTKAEALRQAQIALITGDSGALGAQRGLAVVQVRERSKPQASYVRNHPYYWAAFILIGNGL